MNTETGPSDAEQAEHAAAFDFAARGVIAAAVAFAEGVQPVLTPLDAAKIYCAAAGYLAGAAAGRAGAVGLLRDLAGAIERGDERIVRN